MATQTMDAERHRMTWESELSRLVALGAPGVTADPATFAKAGASGTEADIDIKCGAALSRIARDF
jgi:hypothetical protein